MIVIVKSTNLQDVVVFYLENSFSRTHWTTKTVYHNIAPHFSRDPNAKYNLGK